MSWKRVKLGELLTESKIESIKSDPDKRITVRLNLKGVEKRPYERGVEGATKYFIRKGGQFIYGKQNLFKGAFGIIPKELDGFESSSDIPAFDIDKKCLSEWLMFYLRQGNFYLSFESIATGTGSRRIQPARLFEVEIPLPSVKEQQKIINDCNFIEKKYCQISDELILQQSYLQQLRQSILQEAVQGKLSEQNPLDEDAATLLKRIKAEKQKLIKEGKLKKEKELPPIKEDEIPFELPKGWVWCRFGELIENVNNGLYKPEQYYKPEGIISLRMYNIQDGEINFCAAKRVILNDDEKETYKLQHNDILVNRVNSADLVGKAAIIPRFGEIIVYESMNMRVRLFYKNELAEYINLYLRTDDVKRYFTSSLKQAISQASINQTQLKNLLIALPPVVEQQSIVAKVQQVQQQLNRLESQVQQSREYAEQLLQAVLKEAFEKKGTVYEENEMLSMAAEDEEIII